MTIESGLETQRACREEIDRLEKAIVDELRGASGVLTENINREHRIDGYIKRIHTVSRRLHDQLTKDDGEFGREVATVTKGDFEDFYKSYHAVKDYHKENPNQIVEPQELEFMKVEQKIKEGTLPDAVEFSDEEGNGRFLDLHSSFLAYVNIKGLVEKPDYISFLGLFYKLKELPLGLKRDGSYREYVENIYNYLIDFVRRASPLYDVDTTVNLATSDFEEQWQRGTIPGWAPSKFATLSDGNDDEPLPEDVAYVLGRYQSAAELAMMSRDSLMDFLQRLGLKSGGTADDMAKRLFMVRDLPRSKWPKKLRTTGAPKGVPVVRGLEDVARKELVINDLAHLLESTIENTKENVQRKQARTAEEMENDLDEEEIDADEESEDDEETTIYNPKNIPLGFDGKPIPYWLYKLHGLNQTYICQICGDFPYKGPKNFQRHFQEARHSQAMRGLGIPNTSHFQDITKIEDAYALWKKLKAEKSSNFWKPEEEQEFEDSQGNVLTKKIHDDLKRQGLL